MLLTVIFLAASLAAVASAQGCSICGDGLRVGSPDAIVEFQPGQSWSPCGEIEAAGAHGLIPQGECQSLIPLIYDTCKCIPLSLTAPTSHSAPFLSFNVVFVLCVLVCFVCFSIPSCFWQKIGGIEVEEHERLANQEPEQVTESVTTIELVVTTFESRPKPTLRPYVLMAIFPEQKSGEPDSGRTLRYDPESKQYEFSDEAMDVPSCSICLEELASNDDVISGLCSHVHHRKCIMSWLKRDNDQCPNCRQNMWDPDTYRLVEAFIKEQHSTPPSKSALPC